VGPGLQFLGGSELLGEGSQQEACELAASEDGEMTEGWTHTRVPEVC